MTRGSQEYQDALDEMMESTPGGDTRNREPRREPESPSYHGDDEGSDPNYMRGERYRRQFRK
jgi:hypothetical protein